MKKKVELLAPCGSFKSFQAAINAGADAVYLAGNRFGARAYADNFSEEELTEAIKLAKLYQKKIYLTVNTLVKETERGELCVFLEPYYNAGLDAVIIQDMGVFYELKNAFPDLEYHVSTQMTITGVHGAKLMKEMGFQRVVPARELNLEEVRAIKEETGLEVECFVHGAICYCYSGQCLMSSMIGGRSGNRGRCAQPCRLPYESDGTKGHLLSLKDMNTLACLPELIEAGVDSFKIEGRMKRPEYVAGITALYRKYLDAYESGKSIAVSKEDMELSRTLYTRTESGDGYYHLSRGKDMITLKTPGYGKVSEEILQDLHETYVKNLEKLPISFKINIKEGEKLQGEAYFSGKTFSVTQGVVETSVKHPCTEEEVKKQLGKLGNTPFYMEKCDVNIEGNCFLPVQVLKNFRRELTDEIISEYTGNRVREKQSGSKVLYKETVGQTGLCVFVLTKEQLLSIASMIKNKEVEIVRIYVDADLYMGLFERGESDELYSVISKQLYLRLPRILRLQDEKYIQKMKEIIQKYPIYGLLCATFDAAGAGKSINPGLDFIADSSLYTWNQSAYFQNKKIFSRCTLPLEYNRKEIRQLISSTAKDWEFVVYGRAPVMISANCIRLTSGHCDHPETEFTSLKDRKGEIFPVFTACRHCYNIIYNSVPTMISEKIEGVSCYRLEFSTEDGREVRKRVLQYKEWNFDDMDKTPHTGGHFKRGVE